ncbi:MAG: DUF2961 domain-containing protein [Planctomycetes bacterium]|nr:DUF2961 domain-containing protein [Planctomycetota bacterium]
MSIGVTTLSSLARIRDFKSRRASSYDRTGGNRDAAEIAPGARYTFAELDGPGCIKHIWSTNSLAHQRDAMRSVVLRMWWDGERTPSVEVPLADFFGGAFGICKDFWSLPLQMNPSGGRGMNAWWPMPFRQHARLEIHNDRHEPLHFFYYVDYEVYPRWEEDLAYFHAQWRRENPTAGWGHKDLKKDKKVLEWYWKRPNRTGDDNYVILDAKGRGQYVGCHLDIDCFQREKNDWYGEGDDMIFIDGEPWPPSMHGTGTEDYFSGAYCPRDVYNTPYTGITHYNGSGEWGENDWPFRGKNSLYRFHIEDPLRFEKSIRVTIEHGHANKLSNDYSSTAYWYQFEPHASFPKLLSAKLRLPRPDWPEFSPPPGTPARPPKRPKRRSRGKT